MDKDYFIMKFFSQYDVTMKKRSRKISYMKFCPTALFYGTFFFCYNQTCWSYKKRKLTKVQKSNVFIAIYVTFRSKHQQKLCISFLSLKTQVSSFSNLTFMLNFSKFKVMKYNSITILFVEILFEYPLAKKDCLKNGQKKMTKIGHKYKYLFY